MELPKPTLDIALASWVSRAALEERAAVFEDMMLELHLRIVRPSKSCGDFRRTTMCTEEGSLS